MIESASGLAGLRSVLASTYLLSKLGHVDRLGTLIGGRHVVKWSETGGCTCEDCKQDQDLTRPSARYTRGQWATADHPEHQEDPTYEGASTNEDV